MFYVEFPSRKRPGTICSERYDRLADAVEVCRVIYDRGDHPVIRCDDFRAGPMCQNKWAARPRLEWWMSFPSVGYYKNAACYRAEAAGVRYRSHRAGYRASDTAFRRFVLSWGERLAKLEVA